MQTTEDGDNLIRTAGAIHLAFRSFREFYMTSQPNMVGNIQQLENNVELRVDLSRIHRTGPPADTVGIHRLINGFGDFRLSRTNPFSR